MSTKIIGEDNRELATGIIGPGEDPFTLVIGRVLAGKGQLLHYYFGQGRRAVVVDLGEFRLRGSLRTKWQHSERRWEVRLQGSASEGLVGVGERAASGQLSGGRV